MQTEGNKIRKVSLRWEGMKTIKFSEDYEKLPFFWEGTQATLLAVYPESVNTIQQRYTAFWKRDTQIRRNSTKFSELGKKEYYLLNFTDAIILIFLHHNTGHLFPTIRRNYKEKFEYYMNSIGETFVLKRTSLQRR